MADNVARTIIEEHLVEGDMTPGESIAITIDQTLTQDATGTLVMLELEAMGLDRVKTEVSVQYVDHNLIQEDNKNPDDHRFLKSSCERFGLWFSRPGNGVSHPSTSSVSGAPAQRWPGPTPTRPRPGRSGCWRSAPAAWTSPWPWRAAAAHPHAGDLGRGTGRRTARLGVRQGRHPGDAAPPRRRRRRRPDHRVPRPRPRQPVRHGPPRDRQHGRGTGRHDHRVPRRRGGPPLPRLPRPRGRLPPAGGRLPDLRRHGTDRPV
jgi:hypothetical protein